MSAIWDDFCFFVCIISSNVLRECEMVSLFVPGIVCGVNIFYNFSLHKTNDRIPVNLISRGFLGLIYSLCPHRA